MSWVYLGIAIVAEVIATSALKATDGFTKLQPLIVCGIGYSTAFVFLALTLKSIPVGVSYAVWSGVGIAIISVIGVVAFQEKLDFPAIAGICLIVIGVLVINLFSKASVA